MRTAVMGAGSLGTIIGAFLSRAGIPVELIDANQAHVDALNRQGAVITGFAECRIPVTALIPETMQGTYDLVLLLTKQTSNEAVIRRLLPHLHESSIICTLQNGVPEDRVAALAGRERVLGGVVGFGATWEGPGVSRLTSPLAALEQYAFEIGELDGSITPRVQRVKELLDHVGGCTVVPNLMAIKWSKLLVNATFSGMSAALGCTFGDVLHSPEAMRCVARIADETIKVAHAQGLRLTEMQGGNLELLELLEGETVEDKMPIYRQVWGPHAELRASMLQDLEKGLPTEIDCINGLICAKGRELLIPTPCNDRVVELVREAEAERKVPRFAENLKRFQLEQ